MNGPQTLQVWGGVECTVNRVGDQWMDQMALSGHDRRLSDLELFAALGLRTLRSPFLWEKTVPGRLEAADWTWAKERLGKMQGLGIKPIAGLLHHGSGPSETHLKHPGFALTFSAYAGAFAARFPHVTDYTPINEPLTTARFSCLYGHWFPHERSDAAFVRCVLNQCRGIVLAMRAIRNVNPRARLIQTEDMGRVSSTMLLREQAAFENERRWLSLDLLHGRVELRHPLWGYLRSLGIGEEDLLWFSENPCPPDVIGINHYVTSNRHLDERLQNYPPHCHGGNGKQRYADTEAVRVADVECTPLESILLDTWQRYGTPIAVTECHLSCTREEQMRWIQSVWQSALMARRSGADVQAVTVWGLLGLHNWRSLVTRDEGWYEPGAYELRNGNPEPTGLACQIESLARSGRFEHPVLQVPGWWARKSRVRFPAPDPDEILPCETTPHDKVQPLLVASPFPALKGLFSEICGSRCIPWRFLNTSLVPDNWADVIALHAPWGVILWDNSDAVGGFVPENVRRWRSEISIRCRDLGVPVATTESLVPDAGLNVVEDRRSGIPPLSDYPPDPAQAAHRLIDLILDLSAEPAYRHPQPVEAKLGPPPQKFAPLPVIA